MSWFNIVMIFLMFLTIGYIANLGNNKYIFLKSALLGIILLITSFISLFLGSLIILIVGALIYINNGLFTGGLLIILMSGIIEYLLIKYLISKYFNNDLVLTVVEYFIQWTLIYLTLYQFITQSISKKKLNFDLSSILHILNIDTLNLTILPVLLISWISIAMNKINKNS